MAIVYDTRGTVDDAALTELHSRAFGAVHDGVVPWSQRRARHSLTWAAAYDGDRLVGFVNVIGDGGEHAVVLDTMVDPDWQGHGVGRRLVGAAVDAARDAGCTWLHIDYLPEHADFYERACGFTPTSAGLMRLR